VPIASVVLMASDSLGHEQQLHHQPTVSTEAVLVLNPTRHNFPVTWAA
jgi:hypothetical protein